jgi:hypothetical protein
VAPVGRSRCASCDCLARRPRAPPLANRKPKRLCYTPKPNRGSGDSNRPSEYAWRGIAVICQWSSVSTWLALVAVVRVNFHRLYFRVASIECSFAHRGLSRLTHDICKFCSRIRLIVLAGGQPKESTGLRLGVAFSVACLCVSRGPHFGLKGPFVLLGFDVSLDDVLYLESARRGDLLIAETKEQVSGPGVPTVADPASEVASYEDGFASLLEIALDPDESLKFIERLARDLS